MGRGEERPRDREPGLQEQRRPGPESVRPEPGKDRRVSPPTQVPPAPERRGEPLPGRRLEDSGPNRGEERSRDRIPKLEQPPRPAPEAGPKAPERSEEPKAYKKRNPFSYTPIPDAGSSAPSTERGRPVQRPSPPPAVEPRGENADRPAAIREKGMPPGKTERVKKGEGQPKEVRQDGRGASDNAGEPEPKTKGSPQKSKEKHKKEKGKQGDDTETPDRGGERSGPAHR